MSTARHLFTPEPPPGPTPPSRHRLHRWQRIMGWVSGAFTLLTLLMSVWYWCC